MVYPKKLTLQIEEYLGRHNCVRCNSNKELTIDHIIPIHFLMEQLGVTKEETFDWENFQPMCRKCNHLKAGRIDLSNPKTKPLMIKYVTRYCL